MNIKIINKILLLSFISVFLQAKHTNKTFLTPRSVLYNMPMEFSTWHTQFNKEKIHKWAGSIEATGFYQNSVKRSDTGKYFGIHATHEDENRDYINVYDANMPQDPDGIKAGYIIHTHDEYNTFNFGGKIRFQPSQQIWGLRFDYHQKLCNFFLRISLPLANIKNNLNIKNLIPLVPLAQQEDYPLSGKTLADYLSGNIQMVDDEIFSSDSQYALEYVKFCKPNSHSKTNISDLDISFGYNLIREGNKHIGLYVVTTIPTGNKANGEYLFEPLVGNGNYWNLGLGIDSKFRLHKFNKNIIELLFNFDIRYVFDKTQKRTIGVKKDNGELLNFGQYYLAGKKDLLPLYPLANFLTQRVQVNPNAQLEGLLGLAFEFSNWTIDLGYDLFWKDKESIKLKHKWQNDTYAIANMGYLTRTGDLDENGPFDPDNPAHYALPADTGITGPINKENLDIQAAQSPSQVTNKIYAGLGYACNNWKFPVLFGIGADYEFASSNAALETWALWLKLGLSF